MKTLQKTLIWVTLFSIAMGFLETSVVVYLRKLIYDGGFWFPISPLDMGLAATELYREAATIIMLAGIGILTGKNALERFAWFIYTFAVWDIFYYVFLKALLNWPESLFTWDLLFLIPVPWVGPVITPCLVALSFIVLGLFIIFAQHKGYEVSIKGREWLLMVSGCLVVIFSFMIDYITYANGLESNGQSGITKLLAASTTFVPTQFNWTIYFSGLAMLLIGIGAFMRRTLKTDEKKILQGSYS